MVKISNIPFDNDRQRFPSSSNKSNPLRHNFSSALRRKTLELSPQLIAGAVVAGYCCGTAEGRPSKESFFDDDDDQEEMEVLVNIVIGIVVFFFVAIFAFVLCLCCPICLLAKMRGRRRGVVYRSAVTTPSGATVTTEQGRRGTTITVGMPRAPAPLQSPPPIPVSSTSPSVIAISNNGNQHGKPYPVQESVIVVPVSATQPQHPMPMGYPPQPHYQGYPQQTHFQPPQQQQYISSEDPPPPYPGLPREIDDNLNLPYNPYYSEGPQASAPSKQ